MTICDIAYRREIIELSAKALGHKVIWKYGDDSDSAIIDRDGGQWFNPIMDSGQALDLAMDLSISINFDDDGVTAIYKGGAVISHFGSRIRTYAVRLAIVEAAAEIGRAM